MRGSVSFASGAYVVAGPLVVVLADALRVPDGRIPAAWLPWLVAASALAMSGGGVTLPSRPGIGRTLATLGTAGTMAVAFDHLAAAPTVALSAIIVAIGVLGTLWLFREKAYQGAFPPVGYRAEPYPITPRVRAASLVSGVACWVSVATRVDSSPANLAAITISVGLAAILIFHRFVTMEERSFRRLFLWLLVVAASGALIHRRWEHWSECLLLLSAVPLSALWLVPRAQRVQLEGTDLWSPVLEHPARLLVVTFLGLCASATLWFVLPMSATGRSISLLDAAFTGVSAVCVTGLIVLDTPVDLTWFGQLGVLVHIQLGGLGIMAFSTAAIRLLGRRLSLRHETAVAGLMSAQDRSRLFDSIRRLLALTFGLELVGAGLLATLFLNRGDSLPMAMWRGLFTSISAFCNAGFALQSDSLIPYQTSPAILYTVGTLIVLGGLSPAVIAAGPDVIRRNKGSAQIKIALAMTAALIVVGTFWIASIEWNASLRHLSWADKLHNALFQSVTLRTAGFNSVDITRSQPATLTVMMLWMFIGGNPGGTAGGIKTTTAAILLLAVLTAMRGRSEVSAFKRQIAAHTVYRAAAIATLGALSVATAVMTLQLTQKLPTFLLLYEAFSALGTVGLTIGATPRLDEVGKAIIMLCMFAGRVGPLTMFMFLSNRKEREYWKQPTEDIDVG
ncbi:MAG: potassium transporter TrkG [Polyangiales bacterium]